MIGAQTGLISVYFNLAVCLTYSQITGQTNSHCVALEVHFLKRQRRDVISHQSIKSDYYRDYYRIVTLRHLATSNALSYDKACISSAQMPLYHKIATTNNNNVCALSCERTKVSAY